MPPLTLGKPNSTIHGIFRRLSVDNYRADPVFCFNENRHLVPHAWGYIFMGMVASAGYGD